MSGPASPAASPTAAATGPAPSAIAVRIGAAVIVALAALRATLSPEPLPWFDTDPFSPLTIPMTGPGPAGMLLMDVISILAAAAVLLAGGRSGRTAGLPPAAAIIAGASAFFWHALPGPELDDLRLGATWIAAFAGAWALTIAASDPAARRLAFGVAIGVVALLAARGILEYTIEHDRTVANFEANRQAIFESRGWSEQSPMARAFERRLRQREASGWFGLTNIYGAVVASALVALVGLAGAGWKEAHSARPGLADGWPGALALGALAAGTALWMSQSRGGMLAAGIGLAMLGLGVLARSRPRLARLGGPAAVAVVPVMMGLIAIQGALGTRAGDLSLLFRWFYFRTAGVIFGHEPVVGVGPAGFQAAYQLHKPPISPEDVSDPHNLLLALLATLGIGGAALGALWLNWLWRSGRGLVGEPEQTSLQADAPPGRLDLWLVIGGCAGPTLIGVWLEQAALTPEAALVRLVGLVGWAGLAWGVITVSRAACGVALAASAAAIAIGAQCMIEMGGTFQSSAPLLLAILGLAAAKSVTGSTTSAGSGARVASLLGPVALAGIAVAIAVGGLLPVWRWERAMIGAGREAYVAAQMTRRINDALAPQPPEPIQRVLSDLAGAVNLPPAESPADLEHQLTLLHLRQSEAASDRLRAAAQALARPHQPTQQALSRTLLSVAEARQRLGQREAAAVSATEAGQEALVGARAADTASAWSWLAVVREHTADLLGDPAPRAEAIEALRRANELNPHSATLAWRLFAALDAAREEDEARRWARRALELDELASLDPEGAGLTESQRETASRAAGLP